MLPEATAALARAQAERNAAAMIAAVRAWGKVGGRGDWVAQWSALIPGVMLSLIAAQVASARESAGSVGPALEQSGYPEKQLATVNPTALVGRTRNGALVADGLREAVVKARMAPGSDAQMLATGGRWLAGYVQTAVADAARSAAGIAITAHRNAGYVRWEPAPYCHRCAPLVGKFFAHNQGFQRHPHCDAVHRPASSREPMDGYSVELDASMVHDLTDAEKAAIDAGADIYRVLNADRTSDRSMPGWTPDAKPGSLPWIYMQAGTDRAAALTLFTRYGYVR